MDEVIVLSGEFLFLQDGGEVKYSTINRYILTYKTPPSPPLLKGGELLNTKYGLSIISVVGFICWF